MNEKVSEFDKVAAPSPIRLVVALLALQALAVFVGAVWTVLGVAGVIPSAAPTSVQLSIALVMLLLVMGAWIIAAIRWCLSRRGIGRSSALALLVFQFAIGLGLLQGAEAQPTLAAFIVLPPVVGAISLLSPQSTEWFTAGKARTAED